MKRLFAASAFILLALLSDFIVGQADGAVACQSIAEPAVLETNIYFPEATFDFNDFQGYTSFLNPSNVSVGPISIIIQGSIT